MYTVPIPEVKFNQHTRQQLGEAIYLLGHLIQRANWETGVVLITQEDITAATGFPLRTTRRWISDLVDAGEISARRVRNGTLVTILDFEPMARTRGKKYRRPPGVTNRPNLAGDPAANRPNPVPHEAADGLNNRPVLAEDEARFGLSNIKEILFPNRVNSFQTDSHPSLDEGKASAPGLRNELKSSTPERLPWEDGYHDKQLAKARELICALDEQERQVLRTRAMEGMEVSTKRFLRVLVRRSETGELEPAGKVGERNVVLQMAEMLQTA